MSDGTTLWQEALKHVPLLGAVIAGLGAIWTILMTAVNAGRNYQKLLDKSEDNRIEIVRLRKENEILYAAMRDEIRRMREELHARLRSDS